MSEMDDRDRPTLNVTRGLPGCGKTTRAKAWVAAVPLRRTRLNRDDLRDQMFGGWTGEREQEDAVTAAQHAAIGALLAAGWEVVADDTNLRPGYIERLRAVAEAAGARFVVWDMTNVPLQTCINRDAVRAARGERYVGEDVIRRMHAYALRESRRVGG
jgi:predicted kinase